MNVEELLKTAVDDAVREVPPGFADGAVRRAARTRRRARVTAGGGAALVVAAAAVPLALTLAGRDDDAVTPAPAHSPSIDAPSVPDLGCPDTSSERYDAAEPHLSAAAREVAGPDAVPDDLRLLWPAGAGAPPGLVIATDRSAPNSEVNAFYAGCRPPSDRGLVLVDLDGDTVTRAVHVRRTGGRHVVGPDARVLDVGGAQVRVDDGGRPEAEFRAAEWEGDGVSWTVQGAPLTDDDVSALVRAMRVTDGRPDLRDWAVAASADYLFDGPGPGGAPLIWSYDIQGPLSLSVRSSDEATPWLGIEVGNQVTDVGGWPAVLSEMALGAGWTVTWNPSADVTATLSADVAPDELLRIAESIAPVAADDPRLVTAWATTDSMP